MRSRWLASGIRWKVHHHHRTVHRHQTRRRRHRCLRLWQNHHRRRHLAQEMRLPLLRQSKLSRLHLSAKGIRTHRLRQNPAKLRKYSARLSKLSIGTPWLTTLAYTAAVSLIQQLRTSLQLGYAMDADYSELMDTRHKSIVRMNFRALYSCSNSVCAYVSIIAHGRFTQTLGPSSICLRVCPAWTPLDSTTRYPILLNTPAGTLYSELLVIEWQLPAYSERGEDYICASDSKDPITLTTTTDCYTPYLFVSDTQPRQHSNHHPLGHH